MTNYRRDKVLSDITNHCNSIVSLFNQNTQVDKRYFFKPDFKIKS
jgi:hypothetical protein